MFSHGPCRNARGRDRPLPRRRSVVRRSVPRRDAPQRWPGCPNPPGHPTDPHPLLRGQGYVHCSFKYIGGIPRSEDPLLHRPPRRPSLDGRARDIDARLDPGRGGHPDHRGRAPRSRSSSPPPISSCRCACRSTPRSRSPARSSIPARLAQEVVRALKADRVTLAADGPDGGVRVSQPAPASTSCTRIPVDDFPRLPELDPERVFDLDRDAVPRHGRARRRAPRPATSRGRC